MTAEQILRNKFESRVHQELKSTRRKFSYETEKIPYVLNRNYIPDFIVTCKSGKKLYIECKGHLRPEHKSKMVAVKRQHPELDIRIVFYSSNKKYIKWATKHGFIYAIGSVPEEWLQ